MLEAAVLSDPGDVYSRFKLLELARFWADEELGSEAARGTLEALRSGSVVLTGSHVGGELLVLIARFLHPDSAAEALALIAEFSAACMPSASFHFGRGELREQVRDFGGAEEDYRACLELDDPTLQMVRTRPLMGLVRLGLARGEVEEALVRVDEVLADSPQDPEALFAALAFRFGTPGAVEAFLAERELTAGVRRCLTSATEVSARGLLKRGEVEAAHGRLADYVESCPILGVGMLVCDLILGRSSDLELDVELDEASASLEGWVLCLKSLPSPELLTAFRTAAPAIHPVFPWLAGRL